jgi:hypothetical protein
VIGRRREAKPDIKCRGTRARRFCDSDFVFWVCFGFGTACFGFWPLQLFVDLQGLLGGLAGAGRVLFVVELGVGGEPVERAFDVFSQVVDLRLLADLLAVLEGVDWVGVREDGQVPGENAILEVRMVDHAGGQPTAP